MIVNSKVLNERKQICKTCPEIRSKASIDYCGKCGCPIASKALFMSSSCPEEKWLDAAAPLSIRCYVHPHGRMEMMDMAVKRFYIDFMRETVEAFDAELYLLTCDSDAVFYANQHRSCTVVPDAKMLPAVGAIYIDPNGGKDIRDLEISSSGVVNFVFGSDSDGLPEHVKTEHAYRIPTAQGKSLWTASAIGIVLRQCMTGIELQNQQ